MAPDVRRLPVVVQPAGAVIASLFRNVTWASMSDPVATEAGRVTVTDVAFVAVELVATAARAGGDESDRIDDVRQRKVSVVQSQLQPSCLAGSFEGPTQARAE